MQITSSEARWSWRGTVSSRCLQDRTCGCSEPARRSAAWHQLLCFKGGFIPEECSWEWENAGKPVASAETFPHACQSRCARLLLSLYNLETRWEEAAGYHSLRRKVCRAPNAPRTRRKRWRAGESCRCLWCPTPSSPSLPRLCSGEETMSEVKAPQRSA